MRVLFKSLRPVLMHIGAAANWSNVPEEDAANANLLILVLTPSFTVVDHNVRAVLLTFDFEILRFQVRVTLVNSFTNFFKRSLVNQMERSLRAESL
jgi:hypothetical protein